MSDDKHAKKLWQKAAELRKCMRTESDSATYSKWSKYWQALQNEQPDYIKDCHEGAWEGSPIEVLMLLIELGEYPPPELMLILLDCYKDYLAQKGDFEDLLFGRPKPKAGNHALQQLKRKRDIAIRRMFDQLLRQGYTRTKAAEKIVQELKLGIDAESLLRKLRGFAGYFTSEPIAEK